MGGCSTQNVTGDYDAAGKKVTFWAVLTGIIAAGLTYLEFASILPLGAGGLVATIV
jgi:hypothetical protein